MASRTGRIPKYRHHKARDLAKVCIDGKEIYLGKYNSPESLQKYDQVIGEWLANGRVETKSLDEMTIEQLAARYEVWATDYYSSGQVYGVQAAIKLLVGEYGRAAVSTFEPACLLRLQESMIEGGQSRRYINDTTDRIKRIFKWGVPRRYVRAEHHAALTTVTNLQRGRSRAHEPDPIGPIDDTIVEKTLPRLPDTVAAMVQFQRLTGCRPGEVRILRPKEVDHSGDVWLYRPQHHKNEYRGKSRTIAIGPKAQEILKPRLLREEVAYCFPSDGEGRRCYTKDTYARAITRVCKRANIDHWSPNQLRHTAGTEIRKLFGLEEAQVILGHATADVTQIYAERDLRKAVEVAKKIG